MTHSSFACTQSAGNDLEDTALFLARKGPGLFNYMLLQHHWESLTHPRQVSSVMEIHHPVSGRRDFWCNGTQSCYLNHSSGEKNIQEYTAAVREDILNWRLYNRYILAILDFDWTTAYDMEYRNGYEVWEIGCAGRSTLDLLDCGLVLYGFSILRDREGGRRFLSDETRVELWGGSWMQVWYIHHSVLHKLSRMVIIQDVHWVNSRSGIYSSVWWHTLCISMVETCTRRNEEHFNQNWRHWIKYNNFST